MAERWRTTDAEATYNFALVVLKNIFGKAEKWGYLAKGANPAADVEFMDVNNQKERAPTEDEVERVRAESPAWLSRIIRFSFLTGGRSEECRSLVWSNVKFDAGYLTFMHTKSKKNRDYPLGATLRDFLESLDRDGARPFLRDGAPITSSMIGRAFQDARHRAGLDGVSRLEGRVGDRDGSGRDAAASTDGPRRVG